MSMQAVLELIGGFSFFSLHPSERQLAITVCAGGTLLSFVTPHPLKRPGAKIFAVKIGLDIRMEIIEESHRSATSLLTRFYPPHQLKHHI